MNQSATNITTANTHSLFLKNHYVLLILATIFALLPFLTKSVDMDDPVYIWVAQQISSNPWDFFGFDVNWYGHSVSVAEINKNPPVTSYYMALCAALLGWSEPALHFAFIVPAIGLIIGTYKLAELFDVNSLGVALTLLCCPVVLISSTTLMVDITMLSLWVWSIVFWIKGIARQHISMLIIAGLLITLAALTKYIAISLIPLLFTYTLIVEKKFTKNTAFLVIPIFLITLFFWIMSMKYGQNFLSNIFGFSVEARTEVSRSIFDNIVVGIIFVGGCLLFPLFYFHHLFNKKEALWLLGLFFVLLSAFFVTGKVGYTSLKNAEGLRFELLLHWSIFFVVGTTCIYLLFRELKENCQPLSWLLFFWIFGILFFALFLNWSTNGRSILTIAPAIAILLWRRLNSNTQFRQKRAVYTLIPLVPVFFVAISLAWTDYRLARSAQEAAAYSAKNFINTENTLWFQGSWGFQYYMQLYGATRVVINESFLNRGDILIMPNNNSNIFPVPKDRFEVIEIKKFETTPLASVMSPKAGAGFYTSIFGSLPYVLGTGYPEVYYILRVIEPWKAVLPRN